MGRSYTPAYAIEVVVDRGYWTPAAWPKQAGRPTAANLAKYVALTEASTQAGGCNEHLGPTKILKAEIFTNRGEKKLVASWEAK